MHSYYFEVVDGPRSGKRIPIPQMGGSVGSHANAMVLLPGVDIAPFHAVVGAAPEGMFISDECGQGIEVNGKKVKKAVLAERDVIQIGDCKLQVFTRTANRNPVAILPPPRTPVRQQTLPLNDGISVDTNLPAPESAPNATAPATQPVSQSMQWLLKLNGMQIGPVGVDVLQQFASSGQLKPEDSVCVAGTTAWIPAAAVNGLFAASHPFAAPAPSANAGAAPPLPDRSTQEWYYELDSQRMGPVTESDLRKRIATGSIKHGSLVWTKGLNKWTPFEDTELAGAISGPPPLTGSAVGNGLAWLLAFAPIIGQVLEGIAAGMLHTDMGSLWFITVLLNVIISAADEKLLKKAGHDTSKMGASFIVPVYLYKRSDVLKQSKAYFIIWCIGFVLVVLV